MKFESTKKWQSIPLADLVAFSLGGDWGKDNSAIISEQYTRVKVIRGTDFKNWANKRAADAALRLVKNDSVLQRKLAEKDLVVEISGGGPDQPVGRVIFIDNKAITQENLPLICSNFFRQIRIIPLVDQYYVYRYLDYSYYSGHLTGLQTQTTNLRNLNFKRFLTETLVPLPSISEQKRIVSLIENLDNRIHKIRQKLDDAISKGQSFLQSYIAEAGANLVLFGTILTESTERIGNNWVDVRKVGVDNLKGIIPLRTGRKQTFEKYKIVRPGYFIYNPMRINIGSIALYEGEEIAITSPDYVVFEVEKNVSKRLILRYLKSTQGLSEINNNTRGSVRSRLYFDSLSNIPFPYLQDLDVQNYAEITLKAFETMEEKKLFYEKKMTESLYNYIGRAFKGEFSKDFKSTKTSQNLLKDLKDFKLNLVAQKSVKMAKKRTHIDKKLSSKSIKELIVRNFGNTSFSFLELENLVKENMDFEYDDLKEIFFNLLRDPLKDGDTIPTLRQASRTKEGVIKFEIIQ